MQILTIPCTMTTTFWLSNGYNFGYVIASGTIFDSGGWVFVVKLSDEDLANFEVLRDTAMATNFGSKICNFLCVNNSDQAISYGGGLSGRPTKCRYC